MPPFPTRRPGLRNWVTAKNLPGIHEIIDLTAGEAIIREPRNHARHRVPIGDLTRLPGFWLILMYADPHDLTCWFLAIDGQPQRLNATNAGDAQTETGTLLRAAGLEVAWQRCGNGRFYGIHHHTNERELLPA